MKYIKNEGSNNHLIITLHGTGGKADDLFEIADYIDPLATKVGFQGEVNENGMSRYFARYPGGGFDLESLKNATIDLDNSIKELIKEHEYENYVITILGYSNGANLAKNMLKEFEDVAIHNALLLHPSLITPDQPYKNQATINVFITSGTNDPYISESEFIQLKQKMVDAKIKVESFTHNHGHQLMQQELDRAKVFLSNSKGVA